MEDVGALADEAWEKSGRLIAGVVDYEAIEFLAVKNAHPALPIFLT